MSGLPEALVLPVEPVAWTVRNRNDRVIVALADRHYSRQTRGAKQMGAPATSLAFVSPCERAGWLSQWTHHPDDGLLALRCAFFRNEGAGLSSELIRAAMELTEAIWPPEQMGVYPRDGWVTWVKPDAIASPNPGYCFKQAGWWTDHAWNPARGRRGKGTHAAPRGDRDGPRRTHLRTDQRGASGPSRPAERADRRGRGRRDA